MYENRADDVLASLNAGASVTVEDELGQTPLHWAVRQNHEAIARMLLERGADASSRGRDGTTPIHVAAGLGSDAVVEMLLSHSADPCATRQRDGRGALHLAAEQGWAAALAALLRAERAVRCINTADNASDAPLTLAAKRGHASCVRLLAAAGAALEG